jgi:FKBP-type peptidyl-prolyl cis-trans isomerase FkpA
MIRRSLYLLMIGSAVATMAQAAGQAGTTTTTTVTTTVAPADPAQAAAAATIAASVQAEAPVAVTAAPTAPGLDPLVVTDTVVGKGKTAGQGSKVFMHYTGWLYKSMAPKQHGRKFDSSFDRGEPLEFVLGTGRVIKGWDQGILGMKVGGKRTLIIPSHLAYGNRGAGDMIAPGADLIFDDELMDVK